MNCKIISTSNNWRAIADAARTTVNKEAGQGEPSSAWKRKILLAEHSPIRKLWISAKMEVPYWVAMHLRTHTNGVITPTDYMVFVGTQRTDKTGIDRDKLSQNELVILELDLNAQAIINISRKRLCNKASAETRKAWYKFLLELSNYEIELFNKCVRECIYRGFCPEMESCGYTESHLYKIDLNLYRGTST